MPAFGDDSFVAQFGLRKPFEILFGEKEQRLCRIFLVVNS